MRLNARSTTADSAISDAIVIPLTVVIGIAALRSTWRRTTRREGRPRLIAVCTCSRAISSRTLTLVTRATSASAESGERDRGQRQVPEPVEQPRPGPERREPAQLDREDRDQHDRRHERRDRREHGRPRDHRRVERPAAQAGEHPEPDPEQQDQDRRVEHELGRHRGALGDQRVHALAQRDRVPEVAVDGRAQPVPVLRRSASLRWYARAQHVQRLGRERPAAGQRPAADHRARSTATRRWRSSPPAGSARASPAGVTTKRSGSRQPLAPLERGPRPAHVLERGRRPGDLLVHDQTVLGAASGIHGSVSMIRLPASAVCSARCFWSVVVRASSSAFVIRGSSKPS